MDVMLLTQNTCLNDSTYDANSAKQCMMAIGLSDNSVELHSVPFQVTDLSGTPQVWCCS